MKRARGCVSQVDDVARRAPRAVLAIVLLIVLLGGACSSSEPHAGGLDANTTPSAGMSTPPSAAGTRAADSPAVATAGVTGAPAAGNSGSSGASASPVSGSAAGGGAAAPAAGSAAASGATGATAGQGAGGGDPDAGSGGGARAADCKPVTWPNPGMVPDPKVVAVAPEAGNGKIFGAALGLDAYRYLQSEFFFSGTMPAYTTRMVVNRPEDPAKFSGTVVMEWVNVTAGFDYAVDWAFSREYLMRAGHVVVAVSAQKVGADYLKATFDAQRYATIQHPGDNAANAIFSQAAMAIRTQTELLLGPCMPVRAVLAAGQSQSSVMLARYIDSVQPKDRIYDGFFVHAGGEPSTSNPAAPVLVMRTMTEGNGTRSDGPNLVVWVVAGATHSDARILERGRAEGAGGRSGDCTNKMNDFPSWRVYNAGFDWLHRWVRKQERPPSGPPFEVQGGALRNDARGNVLGGIRLPEMEAPTATYTLSNSSADPLDFLLALACGLSGSVLQFTDQQLMQLYPTHDDYVKKYTAAADKAVADGYLLRADYELGIQQAQNAAIPN